MHITTPTNLASPTHEQTIMTKDDNLVEQEEDIQNDNLVDNDDKYDSHLIAEMDSGPKKVRIVEPTPNPENEEEWTTY
eukprot:371976-Ditylum_brightwellii.AAC.1